MKSRILSLLLLMAGPALAQSPVDVIHYRYELSVSDDNDTLKGTAYISLQFTAPAQDLLIDLAPPDRNGKGMKALQAEGRGVRVIARQGERLQLFFTQTFKPGDTATVRIDYAGIPSDGLIISRNRFGQRTFFSDNWPNRAHYWIPCVDDPADKATVEFIVTAPAHYRVIANGKLIEESTLSEQRKLTHWKEEVPLPTKVMVIGVAEFAVQESGSVNGCVPVSSWVFPENREAGFYDYAPATDILQWFIGAIGPYAYPKLANVQSKTRFGGMENAGAIFYNEYSITGKRQEEDLLVHEIAHQWFGNMATEKSFAHLWLSEGFATYLTHLYWEEKYGPAQMAERLASDRQDVLDFVSNSRRPVVDTTSNLMSLLNANSYKKGGWVLHMLRRMTGDSTFRNILRTYYAQYAGKNADTDDFRKVAEKISGRDLRTFFTQWLHTPVNPKLRIRWGWLSKEKKVTIQVEQVQAGTPFEFPLDVRLEFPDGKLITKTFDIRSASQSLSLPAANKPVLLTADPGINLLADIETKVAN